MRHLRIWGDWPLASFGKNCGFWYALYPAHAPFELMAYWKVSSASANMSGQRKRRLRASASHGTTYVGEPFSEMS